jgi:hypothetical protein
MSTATTARSKSAAANSGWGRRPPIDAMKRSGTTSRQVLYPVAIELK